MRTLDETPAPRIYASALQIFRVKVNLVARTDADPSLMIKRIEDAIRTVDPQQTFTAAFTLDDAIGEAAARPRLYTVLLGLFVVMGLVLGALGIYGVLAGSVAERTREIGVRSALGASPGEILTLVVRQGMTLTALGIAVGLAGAALATRALASMLFGISSLDPLTYVAVVAILGAVSMVACWTPASPRHESILRSRCERSDLPVILRSAATKDLLLEEPGAW